jgi:hypothetical protein
MKNYIIGNIYKTPYETVDKFTLFYEEFSTLLDVLSRFKSTIYVSGDYNIDLLKINTKSNYKDLFDNVVSFGFYPKLTLPTRLTDTSSTLIDNIYTNKINANVSAGILINQISDHQVIFLINDTISFKGSYNKYVEIERINETSISRIVAELEQSEICLA